jgi:hypothetical protein
MVHPRIEWSKIPALSRSGWLLGLLQTEHLNDQLAGLAWLQKAELWGKKQDRGNGQLLRWNRDVLGAEKEPYCAAVDASGGADSGSRTSVAVSDDQGRQQFESPNFLFPGRE